MKIRIEGICGGSKVGIIIDSKYLLYVAYIYEDVLPSKQLTEVHQYYVVFDPIVRLQPIITTDKLSPRIKEWIDEQIVGRVWNGYLVGDDIPD